MPLPNQRYVASLLDRLTDERSAASAARAEPYRQRRLDWEATLLSEVELLLNTKRSSREVPEEYRYTSESLLVYGLPDCTGMSVRDPEHQSILRSAIEAALRRFEPRLTSITVSLEPPSETEPTLRFRVEALARAGLEIEPLRFETVLQVDRSRFAVKKDA